MLSTGEHAFYESLGWRRWQGPTWVRTAEGRMVRTEEEDDGVMAKPYAAGLVLDLAAAIACDERPGDSW